MWEKLLKTGATKNFLILMSEAEFLNSLGTSEYKCALEFREVLGSLCEARERNGEDNSVFSFNPIKSFTKIK